MGVQLRRATSADVEHCGRICYDAFGAIADAHRFPREFPAVEAAIGVIGELTNSAGFVGFVAELDGRIVGSNFLDVRSPIHGLGPITVDPGIQDGGVGRALMAAALDYSDDQGAQGVRLLQAAYHNRSLSLYAKLGFAVREPVAVLQGPPLGGLPGGPDVRAAHRNDLEDASRLCVRVHGHERSGELGDALDRGTATVVERDGRITGYSTGIAFFGHSVAETNTDMQALIGAAPGFGGPGFLLPLRNADLLHWCLDHGLRVVQMMNLMSIGWYREPEGAYLPSVTY
ncbi:GNAT family N-acetyltransferase [Mycobacterium deserti]|uniref:GNAT family N-acetyltransferase n=1 Tax=Mycobacterium deserti TaxID=2978347 RepID=A0ABT2MDI9_9MYCO|nr:GNAT family N-acetyltransferase [Mycobacterium deserti]MCT7660328.1 GNAT family N-acetyltransferase [Mycobacterium deserti]